MKIILIEDYQRGEQVVEKLNVLSVLFASNGIAKMIYFDGIFVGNCIA